MSEKERYTVTFETWNKVASLYQDKFMHLDLYNDTYDLFCNLIKIPNAQILDIGCGPGNITSYLLSKQKDLKVHGIDIASEMIALAKTNNPNASFEVLDSREIDCMQTKFSGIISGFCLPYLSQQDAEQFIKDCYNLMHKNGILYLSFVEGNYTDSGYKTASSGDQVYFYYYESAYMLKELEKHNFEIIEIVEKNYSARGGDEIHKIIIARK